ncbi:MAG: aminoglycoside/hydroxyurea antibiotic resistance kinase [Acidimicrobiales bacterium]|nr:aminoglycoside/hydroxyurea antibiotic resistance kinase [Acidimicrobiales bacterium]
MTVEIPPRLSWLHGVEGGSRWLGALPQVVDEVAERWRLTLGAPFTEAYVSYACPATTPDGAETVLKIQFPHPECRNEADALRRWGGVGAIRLLAHDQTRHALLLERCKPGTHLSAEDPNHALDVLVGLIGQTAVPVDDRIAWDRLDVAAAQWSAAMADLAARAGPHVDARFFAAAAELATWLGPTQGPAVLVNQDLHGDNVLRATRSPWLVIDPKPIVGELAFAGVPVVRSYEFGHSRRDVRHRLDRVAAELGVDRDRVRGWTVAHTVTWLVDAAGEVLHHHLDTLGWLLDDLP